MAKYRIYVFGDDGHIIDFEALVCEDDAHAIERAKQILDGRDLQVWSGPRFVTMLKYETK